MTSFYVIAHEHRILVERIKEDFGDDEQTMLDTIESISFPLEEKATAVAYAIKELELLAGAVSVAEKEIAERRKKIDTRLSRLRDYALDCLQIAGGNPIETPHFRISVRKNPVSVEVFDAGLIPEMYMRQKPPPPPEPDKTLIREAISGGTELPGARLVQTMRLEIK